MDKTSREPHFTAEQFEEQYKKTTLKVGDLVAIGPPTKIFVNGTHWGGVSSPSPLRISMTGKHAHITKLITSRKLFNCGVVVVTLESPDIRGLDKYTFNAGNLIKVSSAEVVLAAPEPVADRPEPSLAELLFADSDRRQRAEAAQLTRPKLPVQPTESPMTPADISREYDIREMRVEHEKLLYGLAALEQKMVRLGFKASLPEVQVADLLEQRNTKREKEYWRGKKYADRFVD